MRGFFNIPVMKKSDKAVINITYDPRKKKWLVTREGRRKAYVAFDYEPVINMMGKQMQEGKE